MTPGEAHVVAIEDVLEDLGEALSYVPDYFVDKWFDGSREATVKKHRDALTRGLAPDRTAALETLLAALRAETDRCERCRANHQAMLGCFMHGWALTILMPDASRWVNNVPPGVIEAHAILAATPEPAPVADGTVEGYAELVSQGTASPMPPVPAECRCGGGVWSMDCPVHDLPTPPTEAAK